MSDHPRGRLAGWILLALAGLAVAVALSVAASNLSTQPIGLSGEPLRAGDRLAPSNVTRAAETPKKKAKAKPTRPKTTTTQTQSQTTVAPAPTTTAGSGDADSDDHGGNRHADGDDD